LVNLYVLAKELCMPSPGTAEIIQFPARRPAPATDGQDRLTRALAALDSAIAEQRAAMVTWREALDDLKKTTHGLGLSMQRYRGSLDRLGDDVATLHQEAVRLERWADDALADRR
jgi:hypothetical protein